MPRALINKFVAIILRIPRSTNSQIAFFRTLKWAYKHMYLYEWVCIGSYVDTDACAHLRLFVNMQRSA